MASEGEKIMDDYEDFDVPATQSAGRLITFLDNTGVTMTSHAECKGKHKGTGDYDVSQEAIDPATVRGTGKLDKKNPQGKVRCYFFQANDPSMVPSHFAAVAPKSIAEFDKVNIFFHPAPDHADPPMTVDDYPDLGTWAPLFRYMPILGAQLAGSGKAQLLIMPYVPSRMFATTGQFAQKWRSIVTGLAKYIKYDLTGAQDNSLSVSSVIVSSFSWGIKASDGFRTNAGGLNSVLQEIWDFDGMFSQEKQKSVALRNTQRPRLIQYQQALPTLANSFNVGPTRWTDIDPTLTKLMKTDAVKAGKAVHRNVPMLFYHACETSAIG
jgi:hypothetical protein